jgi:hypothetical protein
MPHAPHAVLASVLVASLVGCGGRAALEPSSSETDGDGGATASVVGAVHGVSLPTAYAIAVPDNSNASNYITDQYTTLTIAITDHPLACDSASIPNTTLVGIKLSSKGGAPVGVGTYTIDADATSSIENLAALVTLDAQCNKTAPAACVAGSVTITAVTGAAMSGTFALDFDSGDSLTGTFAAATCTKLPASLEGAPCG